MGIADSSLHPGIDQAGGPGQGALTAADVRAFSLASGLGRVAIGAGLALAPHGALRALGFAETSPALVAISRVAGGRDIVLGVATLAAMGDARELRYASLANAVVDAGDAASFGAALTQGPEMRAAAIRGIAAALPAALAGLWVARRLRGR